MLNFPVTRRQSDMQYQDRVTIDTHDLPDTARQEFKAESDINEIMNRFGVNQPRPVSYGDFDYDIDLQTALNAIEQAERGYDRLPADMKSKYPDWQSVIIALADGEKVSEIRELLKDIRSTPPTQEPNNATRSDAEGSGQGTDAESSAS